MSSRDDRKLRILLLAEAVTLAHVARLVTIGQYLHESGHVVQLSTDPRYNRAILPLPFDVAPVSTIPGEQFHRAISRGSPIYSEADLDSYVRNDLRLIEEFRPDLVIGDFRISLAASARVARVPYVSITNAYWSPYARIRYVVPDIPITRIFGVSIAQKLFDLARPFAFSLHAKPLNRILRKHGQAALPSDLRHTYTDADYTLYADVAEIVPTQAMPSNHRFVGPIAWAPSGPLPDWWGRWPPDQPIVYVTLGSSGRPELLLVVLEALAKLPVTAIAATAGRELPHRLPENACVAPFLPGDLAAEVSSIVICNGGSPTSYQGLAKGKPVIGLASNMDQYLNMSLVEDTGAGRLVRGASADAALVRRTVDEVLNDAVARSEAIRMKSILERYSWKDVLDGVLPKQA